MGLCCEPSVRAGVRRCSTQAAARGPTGREADRVDAAPLLLRWPGPVRAPLRPRPRPVLPHPATRAEVQRLGSEFARSHGAMDAAVGGLVLVAGRHRFLRATV